MPSLTPIVVSLLPAPSRLELTKICPPCQLTPELSLTVSVPAKESSNATLPWTVSDDSSSESQTVIW